MKGDGRAGLGWAGLGTFARGCAVNFLAGYGVLQRNVDYWHSAVSDHGCIPIRKTAWAVDFIRMTK